MINENGVNGKLVVEFDKLEIFGTETETKVIYMRLKEETEQHELLKEVNGLLIQSMIDNGVI